MESFNTNKRDSSPISASVTFNFDWLQAAVTNTRGGQIWRTERKEDKVSTIVIFLNRRITKKVSCRIALRKCFCFHTAWVTWCSSNARMLMHDKKHYLESRNPMRKMKGSLTFFHYSSYVPHLKPNGPNQTCYKGMKIRHF